MQPRATSTIQITSLALSLNHPFSSIEDCKNTGPDRTPHLLARNAAEQQTSILLIAHLGVRIRGSARTALLNGVIPVQRQRDPLGTLLKPCYPTQ